MAIRVGINGFGRIGRNVVRAAQAMGAKEIDFVAVNDLTDTRTLAHLLKYDSVHGRFPGDVAAEKDAIVVGRRRDARAVGEGSRPSCRGRSSAWTSCSSPPAGSPTATRPRCTSQGGAKKVIISAPAKKEDITIVYGVNHEAYDPAKHHIISNASCTTNCLVPVVKVILDRFGFVQRLHDDGALVHQRPADPRPPAQGPAPGARRRPLDHPDHDRRGQGHRRWCSRRSRARSTACRSGCRRPDVSVVALTLHGREGDLGGRGEHGLPRGRQTGPLKGVLAVSDEPLVSVDYIGSLQSSTVDALSTNVVAGTLVNVTSWYDNEMGYSARCVDLLRYVGQRL